MKRRIDYCCSNCGKRFSDKRKCLSHEQECYNRAVYSAQWQNRIVKIFALLESKGFFVVVNYDSNNEVPYIRIHDTYK